MLRLFTLIALIGACALTTACAEGPDEDGDGDSKGFTVEMIEGSPCSEIVESEVEPGC